jgi:hypothetical protein
MTLRRLLFGAVLLAALVAAGYGPSTPTGGEPKPLPPFRAHKGLDPKTR